MQSGFIDDPVGAKKRKLESAITVTSFGILLFGLWRLLRAVVYVFVDIASLEALAADFGVGYSTAWQLLVGFLVFSVLFFDFLIRLAVIASAARERKGKSRVPVYLIFSTILLLVSVISILYDFTFFTTDEPLLSFIVSQIMEFTSLFMLLDLIVSGIRHRVLLRRMRRKE